jgi:hypothetical protein
MTTLPIAARHAATVGQLDAWSLNRSRRSGTIQFSLAPGSSLPYGIFLDSAGYLSGQPTEWGLYSFTINSTASSENGVMCSQEYTLAVAAPSSTWSGYAVSPAAGTTAVGGTWVQPAVTGNGNSLSSTWVGIDGFGGSTVEQIGTAATIVNGTPTYVAWYEFYGDQFAKTGARRQDYYQVNIPVSAINVHPGDTISAEVSLVSGTTNKFLFQMTDTPAGGGGMQSFSTLQTMQYVIPQRSTAAWIVENPNSGAQALSNFGQVTFTGAWATVGSISGAINSFPNVVPLYMASTTGGDKISTPVASNSLGFNERLGGLGSSRFTVTWASGANGTTNSTSSGIKNMASEPSTTNATANIEAVRASILNAGRRVVELPALQGSALSSSHAGISLVSSDSTGDAVFLALGSLENVQGEYQDLALSPLRSRDSWFTFGKPDVLDRSALNTLVYE